MKVDYPWITAARGILALLVLLFHYGGLGVFSHVGLVRHGYMAVSTFFVLSGFILARVYEGDARAVRDFYVARVARVYPAYLVGLILAAPIAANFFYKTGEIAKGASELGLTLFCLQSWSSQSWRYWNEVGWSISCEFFFYALFPFLAMVVRRLLPWQLFGLGAFCTAAALLASGDVLDWLKIRNEWVHPQSPILRLPEFVLGIVAANFSPSFRSSSQWWLVGGTLLLVAIFCQCLPEGARFHGALALPSAVCLSALCEPLPPPPRLLLWLGEISFALYLFHLTFFTYMSKLFGASPLAAALAGMVSLLAAHLSAHYFEPAARLRLVGLLGRARGSNCA